MQQHFYKILTVLFLFAVANQMKAQSGCPGCIVNLPATLAADTVYLQKLPDGDIGKPYSQDVSFRMPKTTTPVAALDSTTPPGLPISKIEILDVEGLPLGLKWEPNQTVFETGNGKTDGCVKICGTPLESDTFVLTIKIKASVLFLVRESSFNMRLYIAPKTKITDGFTMSGFEGCGPLNVQFTNNVPSGGDPGYQYSWDFGNGQVFTGENPPAQTYSQPGKYPVQYLATIDTAGLVLESIRILKIDCSDLFNGPDLYLKLFSPTGTVIFNSSPEINDASLPATIPISVPIGSGNYSIEVWDEDAGIKGTDDLCGSVPFNSLSGDTLTAGGLKVILNLKRAIDTVLAVDTVHVFPAAEKPTLSTPFGLKACIGVDSVLLVASVADGIQWWRDGQIIPGATKNRYRPLQSGYYKAQYTTPLGCSSISDSVLVGINPPPPTPIYRNDNNLLTIENPPGLPPAFAYQWFWGNTPVAGETRTRYCPKLGGVIGVVVTNLATGCSSFYATTVVLNPDGIDCTIGAHEPLQQTLGIYPNPATDRINIRWADAVQGEGVVRLWDVTGRLAMSAPVSAGANNTSLEVAGLTPGLYFVEVTAEGVRGIGRVWIGE